MVTSNVHTGKDEHRIDTQTQEGEYTLQHSVTLSLSPSHTHTRARTRTHTHTHTLETPTGLDSCIKSSTQKNSLAAVWPKAVWVCARIIVCVCACVCVCVCVCASGQDDIIPTLVMIKLILSLRESKKHGGGKNTNTQLFRSLCGGFVFKLDVTPPPRRRQEAVSSRAECDQAGDTHFRV